MNEGWNRFLAAGFISVGLGASSALAVGPSTQPASTDQQLVDRINALEAEVNQLKAQQQGQPPQAGSQLQVPANPLGQVQADADQHSELLDTASGFDGGWNPQKKQFYIGTDDGNFYFHPGVILQFRYIEAYTNNPHLSTNGFEVR